MATTAKGTPYVESSDLVADYPSVSLALAEHIDDFGGKVLQVVRATDTTVRTTTSTSYVDANMSITITPTRSTSIVLILLLANFSFTGTTDGNVPNFQITDSSNNALSGAENARVNISGYTGTGTRELDFMSSLLGYSTPATTSATTYKVRFRSSGATTNTRILNSVQTGQLYAIEVSA